MTAKILRRICQLGYVVVFCAGDGQLELRAQREEGETHVARVDRPGEYGMYVAAQTLAESVGAGGTGGAGRERE